MSTELSRGLQTRHLNMIAIGGSIGTGIFLASGYAISIGGPGGALLAYSLMAIIVYFLMTSLAEMSVFKPTSGTFCEYSSQYVGRSFGTAMGYNYWLNWAITIAAEISAASLIMGYWFPQVNSILFSIVFFAGIFLCNIFSVRLFGEIEYLMSFVKVSVILIFIVLGLFTLFQQPQFGIQHWKVGDAPFHQGAFGFIAVFLFAGFSFQGTELIGVASGEAQNPETSIPRSIKYVFWRLTLFYVLSIGIITLLIAYNDPRLSYQDNVSMSPYTLIFSRYTSRYAADLINFVILVAVLSAANASMYSATRILWYLGKTKQAPNVFSKVNPYAIPTAALIATALIGSLVFVSSIVGNGVLFGYLVQISSLSGFIAWFGIALSHYQFRRKYLPQHGGTSILRYQAKFYPYAQILSMFVLGFVIIAQCIPLVSEGSHHVTDFFVVYSSIWLFLFFYLIKKLDLPAKIKVFFRQYTLKKETG
ncbi:amino acid permease [Aquicella lusitana]|uniref:Lysine:proton symporter (AAT family) n=1 Tax=Aquicella lusitana TaxID=254246 RepID=A0A370GYS4_9COXI|nr:amino acid permease [Aquicella lusitana]RDI48792.1 lysine:proton symporter (AAT family) [Aquicella lusitana]VVC73220.1 Lysine-specific permease [Aquicella lusitana]